MRTVDELIQNSIAREEMTFEEEVAFVNYWFDKYEKGGFCKTFSSNYELSKEDVAYIGKPFEVMRRCTTNECDLCTLPMWVIEFESGYQMEAYPEEICKIEYPKN